MVCNLYIGRIYKFHRLTWIHNSPWAKYRNLHPHRNVQPILLFNSMKNKRLNSHSSTTCIFMYEMSPGMSQIRLSGTWLEMVYFKSCCSDVNNMIWSTRTPDKLILGHHCHCHFIYTCRWAVNIVEYRCWKIVPKKKKTKAKAEIDS